MYQKKAITLVELLISIFILVICFSSLLILYSTSATATQRSKNRMFAAKDVSTVLEAMNRMPLSIIRANKDNNSYWQSLAEVLLPNQVITVTSVNDASWSEDPLHLKINATWLEFGTTQSIELDALLTEHK